MRILRTGFLFLPLLLAACSLPTISTSDRAPAQEPVVKTAEPSETLTPKQTTKEAVVSNIEASQESNAESHDELLAQYKRLELLAKQNVEELEKRLGHSVGRKELSIPSTDDSALLKSKVSELKDYTEQLTAQIVELDQRVEQRREHPNKGDVLQLHLSAVEVAKERAFKAPSLVGKWVRGESRIVKLTENFLVENAMSEPLNVTFTESYQIVINQKLIGTFAPTRSKYELDFDAPTADGTGEVSGTLKLRLESE